MDLKNVVINYSINFAQDYDPQKWTYRFDNRNLFLSADTEVTNEIGRQLWNRIKDLNPDVIFGVGIGGMPLLNIVKHIAYAEDKKNLIILFVRDQRKKYGTKKMVEGLFPDQVKGLRAAFIDDLFDSGRTFEKAKNALITENYELDIVGAVSVVDFWRMHGSRKYNAKGFPVRTVFRRHDFGLTRDDRFLPKILRNLKWRKHIFHDGVHIMPWKGTPTIHNNYLLVGNDNNDHYCFDKNTGDVVWIHTPRSPQPKGDVSITQVHDNRAYWTSYEGTVKCADVDTGELFWTVKADLNLHSSVELDPENNRLFIGTEWNKSGWDHGGYGDGDIVCLNMDNGFERWRTPTRGMIPCTPTYSKKHDYVITGSNDFNVHIVNATTGEFIKKFATRGEVKGKPVLSPDESMAVCVTITGNVYGIDLETLEVVWHKRLGMGSNHQYPYIYDDYVVMSNDQGVIICTEYKTGRVVWLCQLRKEAIWKPLDLGANLLYITRDGQVVTVDKYTGEKMSLDKITDTADIYGCDITQPPAYDGESLYIVTNNKGIVVYDIVKQ
jgi:outer membrane protein assembly factor BamB/orotate phosphoribosyltransferase